MVTITTDNNQKPSYKLSHIIDTGVSTLVYSGIDEHSEQSVIIKTLKDCYPTLEAIARLKHEYMIVSSLDQENIVKIIDLDSSNKQLMLVFEDFGGISLKSYLDYNKPSLQLTLEVAIAITKALIYIHANHIIHKDIKPANIIINIDTKKIKLTDFSIASRLNLETKQITNPSELEGTLAYISPEQTGRMNRSVDYRSDFYSLGVTLYEMLTGRLPFISEDSLDLVYSHIAESATPIEQLNSGVPSSVSAIVYKLMAKNAEDRYQSAKGLLVDLEQCLEQLLLTGTINNFTPGQLDVRSQLLLSQKLYGREEQIIQLLSVFNRVSNGNKELIMVSGYSGIGKTSIINELNKPITKAKGYFISGKFDQFKRHIPYAPIIQAFSSLMRQLLTEPTQKLEIWRHKILNAVSDKGQVIIDVIPEVEIIIGKQPEVEKLDPSESQNRFNHLFLQFTHVFCCKEHPLVIFLDDLQWADSATLKLIQLLIVDTNIKHFLLIGAYRDNEVTAVHPIMTAVEEIEKAGINISNIVLQPLEKDSVYQLIADALRNDINSIWQLSELIFNKTAGNPFFITQILEVLHQDLLIKFDFNQQKWIWNIAEIQQISITDKSIVELVASRIQKLPSSTQDVLKIAACIGNKFTLDILSFVSNKSLSETASILDAALQGGLILPLTDTYQIPLLFQEEEIKLLDSKRIGYKFLHDRVQQAAYSLIADEEKQETHFQIGQMLKSSASKENLEENILDIVNQLNFSRNLFFNQCDKIELASLNLIAGRKAKKSAAYQVAINYLNIGLELLIVDSWATSYEITLNLHLEAAEISYLIGNFKESKKIGEIILEKVTKTLDRFKVYYIQIRSYTTQNLLLQAIETGIKALRFLGVRLPEKPNLSHLFASVVHTKLLLIGRKIEDLLELPIMSDTHKLAAMQILTLISAPAGMAGSLHFPLIVLALVRLSVRYGNSTNAAYGYCLYGAILCDKFANINAGYQFGMLGMKLLEKLEDTNSIRSKTYFVFNAMIRHFKEPLKDIIQPLQEGIQIGLETGDIQFTGANAWALSENLFLSADTLESVERKLGEYVQLTQNLKLQSTAASIDTIKQRILNLQRDYTEECELLYYQSHKVEIISSLGNNSSWLSTYFLCITILSYHFNELTIAIDNARLTENSREGNPGFILYILNNFYYSLSLLANYSNVSDIEQKKYLKQVQVNQNKMRIWAQHAPCNFQHKYDLVEAEKARILGKNIIAAELYDKAIIEASTNGYISEVALAQELFAKFYLEQQKVKFAQLYMSEAYYSYIKWGAIKKALSLEDKYSFLLSHILSSRERLPSTVPTSQIKQSDTKINTNSTTSTKSFYLDISTILKASQALSSEIILSKLLEKLIYLVKENAGAQKVCFISKTNNQLVLEASLLETNNIILKSVPVDTCQALPLSLIKYVEQTLTPLVLDDATKEKDFSNDSYILNKQPKSVLVYPIIYQSKLNGILYLENNIAIKVFTQNRLEVLQMLSAQAAISLENAYFYSTLETRVQERTQQLEQKNQELKIALQTLQKTQTQLIHNEKMSSLGQLIAGIAHEINNPINFIYGNLSHISDYTNTLFNLLNSYEKEYPNSKNKIIEQVNETDIDFIKDDIPNILSSMKKGAARIRDIVKSLRNFSRLDEAAIKQVNIHEGIESTLMILKERLERIEVIKEYGKLPLVKCYANQLNQVFLHLLTNAIDALSENNLNYKASSNRKRTIWICTKIDENNNATISITDNGIGIDDDLKSKIFDPFFTTKPVGKGTGLGLSISHQIIIEKHKGTLECISSPKEGTTFIIKIPHNTI